MYLLTRPIEESLIAAEILKDSGIRTHIEPMIKMKPKRAAIEEYNQTLKDSSGIIITSSNALKVILEADEAQWHKPIYVVGEATAKKAADAGFQQVVYGGEDVNSLCATLRVSFESDFSNTNLLYASGNVISYDIAETLEQHNITIKRVVLYDMQDMREISKLTLELIREGRIKGVFFFSTRSAEIFMSLIQNQRYDDYLGQMEALAISSRVANKLMAFQWKSVKISRRSSQKSLFELLTG